MDLTLITTHPTGTNSTIPIGVIFTVAADSLFWTATHKEKRP